MKSSFRAIARTVALVALTTHASACTLFFGAAHADPDRCASRCRALGMRLAGVVFHGEFASSCVCETTRAASSPATSESSSGAALAAAARPAWRNVPVMLP